MSSSVSGEETSLNLVDSTVTTTFGLLLEVEPSDCSHFTFVLYVGILGSTCVFGIVGNILSFAVLGSERRNRGRVATFLLQTMAVADNLFLLAAGISQISVAFKLYIVPPSAAGNSSTIHRSMEPSLETTPDESVFWRQHCFNGSNLDGDGGVSCTDNVTFPPVVGQRLRSDSLEYYIVVVSAYVVVAVFPFVHVTQMWTVWITVLVAFNRYVAICRPFQAARVCTMKQTARQITVIGVAIVIYCLPRFLEYRVEYARDPYFDSRIVPINVETQLKGNLVYNVVYENLMYCLLLSSYENLMYCLFVFLGPLVIIAVLNACLVRELIVARRRRRLQQLPIFVGCGSWVSSGRQSGLVGGGTHKAKGEENLTLVMVVIVLIFVVCQTPAFINQVLFSLIGYEDYKCDKVYFYYFHVSNVIVSANSSVNFIVYCVFRRQFRNRLRACCRGQTTDHRPFYSSTTSGPSRRAALRALAARADDDRCPTLGVVDGAQYPLRIVVPNVHWDALNDGLEPPDHEGVNSMG